MGLSMYLPKTHKPVNEFREQLHSFEKEKEYLLSNAKIYGCPLSPLRKKGVVTEEEGTNAPKPT